MSRRCLAYNILEFGNLFGRERGQVADAESFSAHSELAELPQADNSQADAQRGAELADSKSQHAHGEQRRQMPVWFENLFHFQF